MASDQNIFDRVMDGAGTLAFRDFERLLIKLGFRLVRISGSHHVYLHPAVGRPFPVQPDGKDAKRYQLRQLRDMIVAHRLTLGSNR